MRVSPAPTTTGTPPRPVSASLAGTANVLTLIEAPVGEWRPLPMGWLPRMEAERQPDRVPWIVDDLIARLRLHGTANERVTIEGWVRDQWR